MTSTGTPSSVADTLRRAKALIADPNRWTTQAEARSAAGRNTFPMARDAAQWCALGAIFRVDGPLMLPAIEMLGQTIRGHRHDHPEGRITAFNDAARRRHMDILKKFDEAIALAERQP